MSTKAEAPDVVAEAKASPHPPIWGMTDAVSGPTLGRGGEALRQKGLTLVETLVILSVLAVVLALVGSNLLGFRRQLSLEDAANTLSQDIQTCRSQAFARSVNCRVRFTGEHSYVVETKSGTGYTILTSRNLPGSLTILSPSPGGWLEFDSRALLTPSSGFPTVESGVSAPEIRLTNGVKTLRLVVSMVGAVKTAYL